MRFRKILLVILLLTLILALNYVDDVANLIDLDPLTVIALKAVILWVIKNICDDLGIDFTSLGFSPDKDKGSGDK